MKINSYQFDDKNHSAIYLTDIIVGKIESMKQIFKIEYEFNKFVNTTNTGINCYKFVDRL